MNEEDRGGSLVASRDREIGIKRMRGLSLTAKRAILTRELPVRFRQPHSGRRLRRPLRVDRKLAPREAIPQVCASSVSGFGRGEEIPGSL